MCLSLITPTAPNPAAGAPHPPASYTGIVILWVRFHAFDELRLINKPLVTGVKIAFDHRPIAVLDYTLWISLYRTPEIGHHTINVVYRLDTRFMGPGP
jgi:hypothetical protein